MDAVRVTDGLPMSRRCGNGATGVANRPAVLLTTRQPESRALQRFIARSYERVYGAHIAHYATHLVGVRTAAGAWAAGVGYTLAGGDPLFVEHYLDQPVEAAIAAKLGVAVKRHQVVEVGNLAACGSGAARRLIVAMAALLHARGRTWVVFTATRSLRNSFARLGIEPIVLARADAARLPDGGRSWGSYYATDPHVMTANIPLGFIHLASRLDRAHGA
ncbi:MAG: thermostable hemolysin [Burkholderiales bacterium]|nr:thermostable hemolysin [Burkholderiales bacterium]